MEFLLTLLFFAFSLGTVLVLASALALVVSVHLLGGIRGSDPRTPDLTGSGLGQAGDPMWAVPEGAGAGL